MEQNETEQPAASSRAERIVNPGFPPYSYVSFEVDLPDKNGEMKPVTRQGVYVANVSDTEMVVVGETGAWRGKIEGAKQVQDKDVFTDGAKRLITQVRASNMPAPTQGVSTSK